MRRALLLPIALFVTMTVPFARTTTVACADCATIQGATIKDSTGNIIQTGYDVWGYNYQSHGFNGLYDNYLRPATPLTDENCTDCTNLEMKWNDAWLSNQDCDFDNKLDRSTPYRGSGAWLTNHMSGSYEYVDDKGRIKEAHWTYFVKIVAVPSDAVNLGGVWYEADGDEIGSAIWGDFAVIQSVFSDPALGFHGIEYLSPANPGLATYK